MSVDQAREERFAVFSSPKYGFRALGIVLLNYKRRHRLETISEIISRFAPPGENDTRSYISHVSQALKIAPDVSIDLSNSDILGRLCRAIATFESGGWFFTDDDLTAGVQMAEGT